MKRLVPLLLLPFLASAQSECEDPYRSPDSYYRINKVEYDPVCGCDGVTYRNDQAAYWWGGLLDQHWTPNTVCGDFDIDLYPSVSSSTSSEQPHLRIFMKYSGNAVLTIFNTMGNLMYEKLFAASSQGIIGDANPFDLNIAQTFRRGIYTVMVTVNGEKKYRKLIRVTE